MSYCAGRVTFAHGVGGVSAASCMSAGVWRVRLEGEWVFWFLLLLIVTAIFLFLWTQHMMEI